MRLALEVELQGVEILNHRRWDGRASDKPSGLPPTELFECTSRDHGGTDIFQLLRSQYTLTGDSTEDGQTSKGLLNTSS